MNLHCIQCTFLIYHWLFFFWYIWMWNNFGREMKNVIILFFLQYFLNTLSCRLDEWAISFYVVAWELINSRVNEVRTLHYSRGYCVRVFFRTLPKKETLTRALYAFANSTHSLLGETQIGIYAPWVTYVELNARDVRIKIQERERGWKEKRRRERKSRGQERRLHYVLPVSTNAPGIHQPHDRKSISNSCIG